MRYFTYLPHQVDGPLPTKDDLPAYIERIDALQELYIEENNARARAEMRGDQLYRALAIFDKRDGSPEGWVAQSARQGYERSHPDMGEKGAWYEFEAAIARYRTRQRANLLQRP